jgi:SAM-dependent methyltransferase
LPQRRGPSWDTYLRVAFLERSLTSSFKRTPPVVLEIGAGTSSFSRNRFSIQSQFLATDIERHPGIQVLCSMTHLPFRDEVFDLVMGFRVLQHIVGESLALREVLRVTCPGGRIVVAVANRHSWTLVGARLGNPRWRGKIPYKEYRPYVRGELESKLRSNGLVNVQTWSTLFLPEALNRLPLGIAQAILRLGIAVDKVAGRIPILRSMGTNWVGLGVKL